jgi:phosphoribosylglycinamide formyltransferase-1
MNQQARLAVFLSGNGSNAEKIFAYFKEHPSISIGLVLSNNPEAYGLQRAKKFNIPTRTFTKHQFRESDEVLNWLKVAEITHIVLAGFLWMIPMNLIKAYPNKIINIHPALLPKFGGKGMYGIKVHEAVKAANEAQTGITLHAVNEKYDDGEIIFQAMCDVLPSDTPALIAEKVQALEHAHYPREIEKWISR